MAYVAGDKILDDQYNTFVNSSSSPFGYNHFAGTGSGAYGLGQTHIATTSAGASVSASQWNTLLTGMDNIGNHTNDTLTARTQVSAGDTIAIKAAVETDLATLAASVEAGCTSATALGTNAVGSSSNSGTWNSTSTIERSVTFADADKMRHFFNAGGKIRIDPSCTTGISGSKDDVFDALTTTATGNLDIGSKSSTRSGSGETLTTNGLALGFHDLTTSYQTIITISDNTYPYTANNIKVEAKLNAAVGSSTNMQVRLTSTDGASDFTYPSSNRQGANTNAYRNGQHRHDLFSINTTTTGGGLANAYSPSSTATDGGTTT